MNFTFLFESIFGLLYWAILLTGHVQNRYRVLIFQILFSYLFVVPYCPSDSGPCKNVLNIYSYIVSKYWSHLLRPCDN